MTFTLGEDDEIRAAELAFGLLDAAERAEAEARLARDPEFGTAYATWASRAAAMFGCRQEPPRPSLWSRIEQRLPANDVRTGVAGTRGWKLATLASSLAAAGLLTVQLFHQAPVRTIVRQAPPRIVVRQAPPRVVTRIETREPAAEPPPPQPTAGAPPLLAVLTGKQGGVALAVSLHRESGRLILAPARLDLGRKVPELWVIPAGGTPHAIGVVPASLQGALQPPPGLAALIQPGATFAVSKEPAGGSPTGQPTGPIILTGTIVSG